MLPPYTGPVPAVAPEMEADESPFVFLGGLFVIVALGLTLVAPGLGIALALLAVPAPVRAAMVVVRRQETKPQTGWERAGVLLGSFGLVAASALVAAVTAGITFFFVCMGEFAVGASGWGPLESAFSPSMFCALLSGAAVFTLILIKHWRGKGQP